MRGGTLAGTPQLPLHGVPATDRNRDPPYGAPNLGSHTEHKHASRLRRQRPAEDEAPRHRPPPASAAVRPGHVGRSGAGARRPLTWPAVKSAAIAPRGAQEHRATPASGRPRRRSPPSARSHRGVAVGLPCCPRRCGPNPGKQSPETARKPASSTTNQASRATQEVLPRERGPPRPFGDPVPPPPPAPAVSAAFRHVVLAVPEDAMNPALSHVPASVPAP